MSNICVVGSINLDIATYVNKYPSRGQTILGDRVLEFPGGKGANQSISCARQGKPVSLIGCVGEDKHGDTLLMNLQKNKVDTSGIRQSSTQTGQTTIVIDNDAENTIIYVEGANKLLTPENVIKSIQQLRECKIILIQMETDYDTVLAAMRTAKDQGIYVILDPAPADKITDELLQYADLILPNEHESSLITGVTITDERSAREAISIFQSKGVDQGILKLGSVGSYVFENNDITFIRAIDVKAVDTVGAGDCFAGVLASALIDKQSLLNAAQHANGVAALKVTQEGAQEGIPTVEEVKQFFRERNLPIYK